MSAKRSSIDSAPIASSIAAQSASVADVYLRHARRELREGLRLLLVLEQLAVGGHVEQLVDLRGVRELHADQPSLAVRVLVDQLGAVGDRVVDGRDLAGERRVARRRRP